MNTCHPKPLIDDHVQLATCCNSYFAIADSIRANVRSPGDTSCFKISDFTLLPLTILKRKSRSSN